MRSAAIYHQTSTCNVRIFSRHGQVRKPYPCSTKKTDIFPGIRPLVRDPNSKNTESLVRNHLVTVSPSGLLTCAGGKWTTYRQMAEDAVDKAVEVFKLKPKRPDFTPNISGLSHIQDGAFLDGTC